jgi:hypothetical protein
MNTQDYAYEVCNVVKAPNDELDSCLILQIQTVIIHKCLLLCFYITCSTSVTIPAVTAVLTNYYMYKICFFVLFSSSHVIFNNVV